MKLYEKYCLSLYGSNLWPLFSKETDKIYKTWNVSTRICFSVPRNTHCYFIEPLSKCPHIKTLLCSRYVNFHKALTNCEKPSVRILSQLCKHDNSTVYGNNLFTIAKLCNKTIDELSSAHVKQNFIPYPCPEGQEWRIPIVLELIDVKEKELFIEQCDQIECEEYLEYLCTT